MNPDVLVVGAGPVGLAMAGELRRYGLSVRIIDKSAQRTDKSKALVVWSRTLELLDRAGCTPAFLAAGMKVLAASIRAEAREIARVRLDGMETPYPFALMIPQSETERLLEEHLDGHGVRVERRTELARFATDADGVDATILRADGSEEAVRASWLIGCDGAHSTVRHALGMGFEGETTPSDWILADVHLAGVKADPPEIAIFWHRDGTMALFPIAPGRYRMIADVGDASGPDRRADPSLAEVQALLDRRGPGGLTASDPIWLASFRINERKVADYRSGRAFLAGDAAHIHSPAGGQGMNTGIQDACNLAWKLALVHRGLAASEPLLSSYNIERGAVGRQVLADAGRLTALAVLKGAVLQEIRNVAASLVFGLSPARKAMANKLAELSVGYPTSPLTAPSHHGPGHPAPGERAPLRGDAQPVGAGDTPRFVLFGPSDVDGAVLIARHPDVLEPEVRAPFSRDGLWLVRPDGYVAAVARKGDWAAIEAHLRRLLRRGRG
ncbi:FAD-dependent monooxygenase [Tundrisphaera sp. TA3]|uniref:FAD-dependent monooxygenase n=1 Tax=Tundrisphaera sp. TA3 TaxID=3435775 RepID=UPI003EB7FD55